MKDPMIVLAIMAAGGVMLSCSANAPRSDHSEEYSPSAGSGPDPHGATLNPIRYGYRGGPYTSFGRPKPKNNSVPSGQDRSPVFPM
jgi:hypothetical protein